MRLAKEELKRVDTHYISKELEGFMARWYIAGIADSAACYVCWRYLKS
jgi:hypothetical protein